MEDTRSPEVTIEERPSGDYVVRCAQCGLIGGGDMVPALSMQGGHRDLHEFPPPRVIYFVPPEPRPRRRWFGLRRS